MKRNKTHYPNYTLAAKISQVQKLGKIFLIPLLVLFLAGIFHKISLIHNLPIQTDELYSLARTCNHSVYPLALNPSIDQAKIYTIEEILQSFTPKSKQTNFIKDSIYYSKNFYKLSNHPPISDIASKLSIVSNKVGILNLRYISLIYWFFSLWVIYLVFGQLGITQNLKLISLGFYSIFSIISLVASFPKAYSLQILLCFLALFFHLKSNRQKSLDPNHFWTLVFFHLAFLTHYFSIFVLTPWLLLIDLKNNKILGKLKSLFYSCTVLIYIPIIKLQHEHTSSYFIGHYGILKELKFLSKNLITFYSLNFYKTFGYLVLAYVIYCYFNSRNKKAFNYYLLLSILPSAAVFVYDLCFNSHMLETIRYSLVGMPFVALALATLAKESKMKFFVFCILLLCNLITPLQNKKLLNEGIIKNYNEYIKSINQKTFTDPSLIISPNYNIKTLIILHGIKTKLMNKSPLIALTREDLSKNSNILVANQNCFINQKDLQDFISKNRIKNVYVIPPKDSQEEYKNLNLEKYKLIEIKY